ncbi:amidohydrolase family protein [Shewanella sp. WXL01]|uniref:amidohydrolase family protein n=1 Tax=Shewanella sp. WXL01 TaxID=2709721 RepID=UPI0014383795|nr:amidohydrolase family protein [Shewanella sp. WXL01]NKF49903.1 amidohydrolase family protein [Shewanella sp. WXL01]
MANHSCLSTASLAFAIASLFSAPSIADSIALTNINIIDVESLTINKAQHVLIEDDRIVSIKSRKPRYKKHVRVIDMSDKYLIPGYIDTHVHHATVPDGSDNDITTRKRLRHLLQGGVTSVRDMGGDVRALSSLKRRAEIDAIQSPDIYYSVIIGGEEFFADPRTVASALGREPGKVDWMRAVDENSDFDTIMLRALGTGATGIKIYAKVPANVVEMLASAAKKHGLKVWSHAYIGPAKPQEIVNAGVETISHAPDISAHVVDNFYELRRKGELITDKQLQDSQQLSRYEGLMQDMLSKDTILDSTLTVFEQTKAQRGARGEMLENWGYEFTKLAHMNGITIATGTDSASDYFGHTTPLVFNEMQLLVHEASLSPLEAIQAATINGAKVIGIEQDYGSIAVGKKANLVVLNQDPSDNIHFASDIAHVIKNGEFVYRGSNPKLPFVDAKKAGGMLWMSGQLGNYPTTMTLAGDDIKSQMTQAMKNIGNVLEQHDLGYQDIVKCTLMLEDIDQWQAANEAYTPFFDSYPTRSAFGKADLALGAKVEVECIAEL